MNVGYVQRGCVAARINVVCFRPSGMPSKRERCGATVLFEVGRGCACVVGAVPSGHSNGLGRKPQEQGTATWDKRGYGRYQQRQNRQNSRRRQCRCGGAGVGVRGGVVVYHGSRPEPSAQRATNRHSGGEGGKRKPRGNVQASRVRGSGSRYAATCAACRHIFTRLNEPFFHAKCCRAPAVCVKRGPARAVLHATRAFARCLVNCPPLCQPPQGRCRSGGNAQRAICPTCAMAPRGAARGDVVTGENEETEVRN